MRRLTALFMTLIMMLSVSLPVSAQNAVPYLYTYQAQIVEVYDADTWTADIDLGFHLSINDESVRLFGVNTPEIRKSTSKGIDDAHVRSGYHCRDKALEFMGLDAKEYRHIARSQPILRPPTVVIETFYDREKFGRTLAIVWVPRDGKMMNLNDHLVEIGCSNVELYNGKSYPKGTLIRRSLSDE